MPARYSGMDFGSLVSRSIASSSDPLAKGRNEPTRAAPHFQGVKAPTSLSACAPKHTHHFAEKAHLRLTLRLVSSLLVQPAEPWRRLRLCGEDARDGELPEVRVPAVRMAARLGGQQAAAVRRCSPALRRRGGSISNREPLCGGRAAALVQGSSPRETGVRWRGPASAGHTCASQAR